jgi:hypothetical protein
LQRRLIRSGENSLGDGEGVVPFAAAATERPAGCSEEKDSVAEYCSLDTGHCEKTCVGGDVKNRVMVNPRTDSTAPAFPKHTCCEAEIHVRDAEERTNEATSNDCPHG